MSATITFPQSLTALLFALPPVRTVSANGLDIGCATLAPIDTARFSWVLGQLREGAGATTVDDSSWSAAWELVLALEGYRRAPKTPRTVGEVSAEANKVLAALTRRVGPDYPEEVQREALAALVNTVLSMDVGAKRQETIIRAAYERTWNIDAGGTYRLNNGMTQLEFVARDFDFEALKCSVDDAQRVAFFEESGNTALAMAEAFGSLTERVEKLERLVDVLRRALATAPVVPMLINDARLAKLEKTIGEIMKPSPIVISKHGVDALLASDEGLKAITQAALDGHLGARAMLETIVEPVEAPANDEPPGDVEDPAERGRDLARAHQRAAKEADE